MRYRALACDYDGTLARHGRVEDATLAALGLELQVVFNKGAVMVLPSGVSKATGLRAALAELDLSPRKRRRRRRRRERSRLPRPVRVRDAVANALETVRDRADHVTRAAAGAGVEELAGALLESDLAELEPRLTRHHVPLGETEAGEPLSLPGYGASVLVAGTSGSGKSTLPARAARGARRADRSDRPGRGLPWHAQRRARSLKPQQHRRHPAGQRRKSFWRHPPGEVLAVSIVTPPVAR